MIASPTAETRVRFVVEYRGIGTEKWIADSSSGSFPSAISARSDLLAGVDGFSVQRIETRIVRETSVITREVLP